MSELHNRIVLSVAEKKLNSRVSHIEKALKFLTYIYIYALGDVPLLAWSFAAVCSLAFKKKKKIGNTVYAIFLKHTYDKVIHLFIRLFMLIQFESIKFIKS